MKQVWRQYNTNEAPNWIYKYTDEHFNLTDIIKKYTLSFSLSIECYE